jgi:nucleoid-associated protein YgaU
MNTMHRALLAVLLAASAAATAAAQSLLDNPFYSEATALLAQAQSALDGGDYDGAASLARQAQQDLSQSDAWVASRTLFYRASGLLQVANDRIAFAKSVKADTSSKAVYDKAVSDATGAKTALDAQLFDQSITLSRGVIDALKDVKAVAAAPAAPAPAPAPATPAQAEAVTLPQYYVVRLVLPLRDCFWRIAAYPFVYNDPWQWKVLYEANRDVLENADNPDLIEVGMRFVIPSINGETRSGDYDPATEYPPLP